MSQTSADNPLPPCGCENCLCRRGPRCRCQSYNELLNLVSWDFGRTLRRILFRR